jgi:rSAM/selenodomain-associated transferase 1
MRKTLIIMLKEPHPGRVKTRLAGDIGTIPATWWMRHQTQNLLHALTDPRWTIALAVSPDNAQTSRFWPPQFTRIPQGGGNLGTRMARALTQAPPGPACLIGADIPNISRAHIARAFTALGHHDAVFGPAPDGGYWLIGIKRRPLPKTLFQNVRWSTPHALADTLKTLQNHKIALTDTLRDVDRASDLLLC